MARRIPLRCSFFSIAVLVAVISATLHRQVLGRESSRQHAAAAASVSASLCQVTARERKERVMAEFRAAIPQPDVEPFLMEWKRDVNPSDAERYQPLRMLGHGYQGSVVAAKDLAANQIVAIKQVKDISLSTLREITFLRLLNSSDYTIHILDAILPKSRKNFTTSYFVMELMDMPLLTKGKVHMQFRSLPVRKQKFALFSILHGLSDIHKAGIYHGDIGSQNIMANLDCKFKIIDFGLATPAPGKMRSLTAPHTPPGKSRVHFRVRPPELMPNGRVMHSKESYEVWMMGCTFLRLLTGQNPGVCQTKFQLVRFSPKPFKEIIKILGMPTNATLQKYTETGRQMFEQNRPPPDTQSVGLAEKYRRWIGNDTELIGLVERMMHLDPDERPSAAALLQDPVFSGIASSTKKENSRVFEDVVIPEELGMLKGFGRDDYKLMLYLEILNHYNSPTKWRST